MAQKNYDRELPPLPKDFDDDEDSVRITRLVKNKEPPKEIVYSYILQYKYWHTYILLDFKLVKVPQVDDKSSI